MRQRLTRPFAIGGGAWTLALAFCAGLGVTRSRAAEPPGPPQKASVIELPSDEETPAPPVPAVPPPANAARPAPPPEPKAGTPAPQPPQTGSPKGVELIEVEPAPEPTPPDVKAARILQAFRDRRPLGRLRGQVLDRQTREPLAARVRVVDAADLEAGGRCAGVGFWCQGSFDVPVVPGRVTVEASAGRFRSAFFIEVGVDSKHPEDVEVLLGPPLTREWNAEGWYLADLDLGVRARPGETSQWTGERPVAADAILAARAEGVQVLGLKVPDTAAEREALALPALSGEVPRANREKDPDLLVLGTFAGPRSPFCGSALGIGLDSWDGLPQGLSGPQEPLRGHLEELRRRGALAAFTDLTGLGTVDLRVPLLPVFRRLREAGFYTPGDAAARLYAPAELPYDTVCGPAYDVLALNESSASQALWFNLLNEGYAVPVIGSGGGCLEGGRVPAGQTLVQVAGVPTREAVIAACRRGRSSVSFGPAVFARIAERDRGPGDRVPADGQECSLQIRAWAARFATLEQIEIIRNGEVLHTEKCGNSLRRMDDFRYPIAERSDAWYVVRVTERYGRESRTPRLAWTNPIYFDTPGRRAPVPARTRLRGTLCAAGGTPLAGSLSLLEPGQEKRSVPIGTDGAYDVSLLSSGTAVFSSPGYDPVARQPFAHPQVQKALAALHCERQGRIAEALAKRSIYGYWRVLLAELEWDVELAPVNKGTR